MSATVEGVPVALLHTTKLHKLRELADEVAAIVQRLQRWRDCIPTETEAEGGKPKPPLRPKAAPKRPSSAKQVEQADAEDRGLTEIYVAANKQRKLTKRRLAEAMGVHPTDLYYKPEFEKVRQAAIKVLNWTFPKRKDPRKEAWTGPRGEKEQKSIDAPNHRSVDVTDG